MRSYTTSIRMLGMALLIALGCVAEGQARVQKLSDAEAASVVGTQPYPDENFVDFCEGASCSPPIFPCSQEADGVSNACQGVQCVFTEVRGPNFRWIHCGPNKYQWRCANLSANTKDCIDDPDPESTNRCYYGDQFNVCGKAVGGACDRFNATKTNCLSCREKTLAWECTISCSNSPTP